MKREMAATPCPSNLMLRVTIAAPGGCRHACSGRSRRTVRSSERPGSRGARCVALWRPVRRRGCGRHARTGRGWGRSVRKLDCVASEVDDLVVRQVDDEAARFEPGADLGPTTIILDRPRARKRPLSRTAADPGNVVDGRGAHQGPVGLTPEAIPGANLGPSAVLHQFVRHDRQVPHPLALAISAPRLGPMAQSVTT